MPTLKIVNLNGKLVHFREGSKTVLSILHENFIDWMHACGGKGRCTTCKMIVTDGGKYLPPLTSFEEKFAQNGRLLTNERLACQCIPQEDLTVRVPDHGKLPHMEYND
ncbi:MAG: 2Fe-2S iron-sulfur cluster-binding protein [Cyclobacteriaceae bacterium]